MKCSHCLQEMTDLEITSCKGNQDTVLYGGPGRCHDCGVQPGGNHHPGCDMETCPTCFGQRISCECES
jgi:hypothetical protein